MTLRGRDPRTWPAASAVGDLAAGPSPRAKGAAAGCEHRWWEAPLAWLIVGLAIAIALIPIAFVGWVVVETCT